MIIFDWNMRFPKENAYLNWWFDDRNPDKEIQVAWDFFIMGKAYYANALTSLSLILDAKNKADIADKLIFPILFGFWHGTELLLKSSIILAEKETSTGNTYSKTTHNIDNLFSELMSRLRLRGFKESDFPSLKSILADFKSKNVLFSFMRYTVDKDWNEQFYVIKNEERENTCINIKIFFKKFAGVLEELPLLTEFLGVPYFGDAFLPGELNKENYDKYVAENNRLNEKYKALDEKPFAENLDITNYLLNWAQIHLL